MSNWPEVDAELLRTLPPLLVAVVRALGFGRARIFLLRHGGVNFNVPKKNGDAIDLTPDEFDRLCETLEPHMDENRRIWLPKPDKLFIRVRDRKIRQDKSINSIKELAREYDLSSRHILNICRERDDRQLDLFS